jgi:hypothetical protein
MTARCAGATNPVEPGTASVIPPTKTQAAVPDETLAHVDERALRGSTHLHAGGTPGRLLDAVDLGAPSVCTRRHPCPSPTSSRLQKPQGSEPMRASVLTVAVAGWSAPRVAAGAEVDVGADARVDHLVAPHRVAEAEGVPQGPDHRCHLRRPRQLGRAACPNDQRQRPALRASPGNVWRGG